MPETQITDGVLLVDKEPEMTSHDVVAIARKRLRIRKIGHTGTLDPLATGLLVLCVGSATRLQSYLMGMSKTYEGTIRFGWATRTYDAAGEPTGEVVDRSVESIDIEPHVAKFRGSLAQVPPAFSAKKIDGVRAYELARRGETPEMEPRNVEVHDFSILAVKGSLVRFRVRCSAGTYVRSIAHDLGGSIGIPAHLHELRRTTIGDFKVEDALSLSRLREMAAEEILASPSFVSIGQVRLPLESVLIDSMQEGQMINGQTVIVKPQTDTIRQNDLVSVSNLNYEMVAIAEAVDVIGKGGGPIALRPRVVLKKRQQG